MSKAPGLPCRSRSQVLFHPQIEESQFDRNRLFSGEKNFNTGTQRFSGTHFKQVKAGSRIESGGSFSSCLFSPCPLYLLYLCGEFLSLVGIRLLSAHSSTEDIQDTLLPVLSVNSVVEFFHDQEPATPIESSLLIFNLGYRGCPGDLLLETQGELARFLGFVPQRGRRLVFPGRFVSCPIVANSGLPQNVGSLYSYSNPVSLLARLATPPPGSGWLCGSRPSAELCSLI